MVCKGTVIINRGVGGQLLHWSDPPNNFWWLSWSPHVFIFQANLSGPPSESFNSFQWSPTFGVLSYDWSPPNKFSTHRPPSPPPPLPPQAINNNRSLKRLWIPAEKVLYKLLLLSLLLLLWRVNIFSCHASVLGDVYYNSIQREEHYSQLRHSTETGFSGCLSLSYLRLVLFLTID